METEEPVYVVTVKEAAAILQIANNTVLRLVEKNVLKLAEEDGQLFILSHSLESYMLELAEKRFDKQMEQFRKDHFGPIYELALLNAKNKHRRELRKLRYLLKKQLRRDTLARYPVGRIPGKGLEKHARNRLKPRYTGDN